MEVSYFFESLRTDFLDKFFLIITEFGGETITYLFLFVVAWCMSVDYSRYFIIVNFYSIGTNVLLKNIFCIPRPWVIDPDFTVVDGAMEAATGYSFPSGHTATVVGVFGSFIAWFKNNLLRSTLTLLIVLVSISRIYLGVHTIWDVLTSLIVGVIILFCVKLFLNRSNVKNKQLWLILIACIYTTIIVIVLNVIIASGKNDELMMHGLKNAYTIFGLSFGYLVSYLIDLKYETKASFAVNFVKVLFGAIFVLSIKEGTKYLFNLILPNLMFTAAIRYFLIVVFALSIWPMSFKFLNKTEHKFRSLKNAEC